MIALNVWVGVVHSQEADTEEETSTQAVEISGTTAASGSEDQSAQGDANDAPAESPEATSDENTENAGRGRFGGGQRGGFDPQNRGERGQRGGRFQRGQRPDQASAQANRESADGDSDAGEQEADDEEELVSVSFNNARLNEVARFFMDRLKKPVLIDNEVREAQISIMSREQMTEADAFELIGTALRQQGVLMVENERDIQFVPTAQIGKINRRLVPANQSVTTVENQAEVVDKVFEVKHYNVERLGEIITPMLAEYAIVLTDPNTGRLIVTDAAANLRRIEATVERLDVPQANQTIEKIIPIKHGDASEIVSMLRIIIAGSIGEDAQSLIQGNTNNNNRGRGGRGGQQQQQSSGPNMIFVEREGAPILLQPDLTRNWIIAVAPPSIMALIERWIDELDVEKQEQEPYLLIDIKHADITEVAEQLTAAVAAMPEDDVRNSVRVIPFPKSGQLLVYGSQRGRNLVRTLLNELDVESSRYRVIEEIPLKHDTAENVKAKIEELFGDDSSGANSNFRFFFNSRNTNNTEQDVKVTADTQRNSITIMTDPGRMERIKQIIEEQWDVPIDLEAVKPKVYELEYVDPVQLQTVLEDMFNTTTTRSSGFWFDQTTESSNPVGRLFGQFSFQALRGTNKLIVSSQSTANYVVIDDLIADLDQPQAAGLPVVIELKHANAEDMAEQLNAMFSEANTPAQIQRTPRGLSDALRNSSTSRGTENTNNQNNNQGNFGGGNNNQNNDPNVLSFWWSQSNPPADEQPISSLIGKPRFVPISRRNAMAFLAPTAYNEPLTELIERLDQPGSQVMIRAVITEIEHNDETTLGVRLASDPSILSDSRLGDQAIGGSANANFAEVFGSGRGTFDAGLNLNVLLQLLIRKFNLQIVNEPRLYTADNQEAHFFDGQDVPTIQSDQSSREDANTFNRSFVYEPVGTRLHVRPHITQEGEIDLEINLELSRIESSETVFGNFIFNRRETTTHVTLNDGQTVVISGIVRQEDFNDVRKLPLLGDIPLLGGLFRSTDKGVRNREVIAFITPVIVNPATDEAQEISERNREWLDDIRGTMEQDRKGEGKDSESPERDPLVPGTVVPESVDDDTGASADDVDEPAVYRDDAGRLPAGVVERM